MFIGVMLKDVEDYKHLQHHVLSGFVYGFEHGVYSNCIILLAGCIVAVMARSHVKPKEILKEESYNNPC